MQLGRMAAWGLVGLLCVGCGGGASSGKKKGSGKKSSGGAAYDKAIDELTDWLAENETDWAGFQKRAAAVRKKVAKSKTHLAQLDTLTENTKTFIKGALEMKVDRIGKTSEDPANEAYWEKYLGQFTDLEKELAAFDEAVAKEQAPKITEWRLKIIDGVFKKDVIKYCEAHRTEADVVTARLAEWRERLGKLGDVAKDHLAQLDEIEQASKEITEWMTRVPPGPINLLAAEHRGAWEKFGDIAFTWDGDELVLTGTGTERKETGSLLHRAFWWTNFEVDVVFQIESKGFSLITRGHPPASGWSQNCPDRVFESGRAWHLTVTLNGEEAEVSGDIDPTKKSAKGSPGGGIGLFVGPDAKVRILKLEVTPR